MIRHLVLLTSLFWVLPVQAQEPLMDRCLEEYDGVSLHDIRFSLGGWGILPYSFPTLDALERTLKRNPGYIVEVGVHTDSRVSDQCCRLLSQTRAKSIVDYLVGKGVERTRLVPKGYEKSQLLIPNSTFKGRSKGEQEMFHQLNRRVTIRVISRDYVRDSTRHVTQGQKVLLDELHWMDTAIHIHFSRDLPDQQLKVVAKLPFSPCGLDHRWDAESRVLDLTGLAAARYEWFDDSLEKPVSIVIEEGSSEPEEGVFFEWFPGGNQHHITFTPEVHSREGDSVVTVYDSRFRLEDGMPIVPFLVEGEKRHLLVPSGATFQFECYAPWALGSMVPVKVEDEPMEVIAEVWLKTPLICHGPPPPIPMSLADPLSDSTIDTLDYYLPVLEQNPTISVLLRVRRRPILTTWAAQRFAEKCIAYWARKGVHPERVKVELREGYPITDGLGEAQVVVDRWDYQGEWRRDPERSLVKISIGGEGRVRIDSIDIRGADGRMPILWCGESICLLELRPGTYAMELFSGGEPFSSQGNISVEDSGLDDEVQVFPISTCAAAGFEAADLREVRLEVDLKHHGIPIAAPRVELIGKGGVVWAPDQRSDSVSIFHVPQDTYRVVAVDVIGFSSEIGFISVWDGQEVDEYQITRDMSVAIEMFSFPEWSIESEKDLTVQLKDSIDYMVKRLSVYPTIKLEILVNHGSSVRQSKADQVARELKGLLVAKGIDAARLTTRVEPGNIQDDGRVAVSFEVLSWDWIPPEE